MSVLDKAIVRVMPAVPKPVVRRISARYIAGTEIDDACRVVRNLNTAGKMATVDVLGEEITIPDEARTIARTLPGGLRHDQRRRASTRTSASS